MRIRLLPLLALLALIGGCVDDTDTPESCGYAATKALDEGRWDRALNLLEHRNCQAAFTVEELETNLAAARIGRAGYDLLDVADELLREDDSGVSTGDRFVAAFSEMGRGKRESLTDLDRAQGHHQNVLAVTVGLSLHDACANEIKPDGLSELGKDACFNNGLLAAAKSASTVGSLLGDADSLRDWLSRGSDLGCRTDRNQNGIADSAELSACAMEIAAAGGVSQGDSGTCGTDDDINWEARGAVAFDDAIHLTPIQFTVNADAQCTGEDHRIGYRLIDTDREISVLTDGYCHADDLSSEHDAADPAEGIWPCPILNANGEPLSADETLVEALNEDVEQFIGMLPREEREDAREELNNFRMEICEDSTIPCQQREDDSLIINSEALRSYLQRRD